jgi:protein-S-isoprenylcysteine O-methyltransferase Ste14
MGLDHFDPALHRAPLVREGIFRYLRNPMYTVGFLILYVPGLLLRSQAALLAAAFQHAYIWVHYYCTELPDMRRIYGDRMG